MVEENGVSENTRLTMMKILKSAMFFLVFFFSAREKECNGDDGEQARANRAATYISLALVGALAVCLPRFFEVHLPIVPEIIPSFIILTKIILIRD